jgi:hypothetical protein
MDEPLEQVRRLVAEVSSSRGVKPETRLFQDLHLAGDDVFELMERIAAKFGTSFSSLSFTDFFPEEHEALGFGGSKKTVTVRHLAEVVKRGAWFDPPNA